MSTTIRQVMTASPHTIGRGQTMDAAHELMRKHRIRHLPVLEGGRLVGVVSVGDLHLVETLAEVDPHKVTVEEAMTPDPYTVSPDAAVRDVAAVMAEHRYGCAIVVEGTHVRGVFTTVDALRALVDVLGGRSLAPRPVPRAPRARRATNAKETRVSWFEELLAYVRYEEADRSALAELAPAVRPETKAIAEEFYERIREHPEAAAVFRDEAQVRRLQQTLQVWVMELLEGPHDDAYFERRSRIGRVHARIGLPQRYMFAAMTLIRLHLHRIAAKTFGQDVERLCAVVGSVDKLVDVELAIMGETFREALLERVLHVEREGLVSKLAAAEARYRDAIEAAEVVFMVLDGEGRALLWNRRAEALTGYARDEVLEKHPLDLLLPDPAARDALAGAKPGQPVGLETSLVTRAGVERFIRFLASCTADPETGTPIRYVIGLDRTDIRDAEVRARASERLAAIGTLAAGLAHEIRNPLNAASLHVTLLDRTLRRLESPPAAALESADVVRAEIMRLSALVTEFLDFARPKPLDLAPVDACELVGSTLDLMRPEATAAGVRLDYDRPARAHVMPADAERLRQVLINLIRNGLEAAAGGASPRVLVRVRTVRRFVEIDVEDTGPGVPPGKPIFDAFFTTKEKGTGLGLAIVHRIIDGHGGTIDVKGGPGATVFTVRLPVGGSSASFALREQETHGLRYGWPVIGGKRGSSAWFGSCKKGKIMHDMEPVRDSGAVSSKAAEPKPEKSRGSVLVVDDEANARKALRALLTDEGFEVQTAGSGQEALDRLAEWTPDVLVTDLKMPGVDGMELLRRVRESYEGMPVVLVTAFGAVDSAVSAMRQGAADYLLKPIQIEELVVVLDRVLEHRRTREEVKVLRERVADRVRPENMVGDSPAMQTIFKTIAQVAPSKASVLITGESGTGKELVAQAIHEGSPRRRGPFVKLHCAALAESVLESELFGHEKGSFTGAAGRREGRFKQADGGTLFLDEVGEIPASIQVKLLRFLQERTFERVGSNETVRVDVRIVAATNRDLAREVKEGRFREDLYYRLNVVTLEMPPLRVRSGDTLALAQHFLHRYAKENGKKVVGFEPAALARLAAYSWPGNVRELENVVERAVVMCQGAKVGEADIPVMGDGQRAGGVCIPGSTFAEIERHAILTTLEAVGGSTTKAARMLDISVRTIQYRLHEYGLARKPPGREGSDPGSQPIPESR